jgi:hypothetical protein
MNKIGNILLIAIEALGLTAYSQTPTEDLIRAAVERQITIYPNSTLRDIYKNFFQDRFGPGHIITDTAAATRYLSLELASCDSFQGPAYELTGYEGRFYRVNLSVIKNGTISYDRFFDAFIRSTHELEPVSPDKWRKEWKKIDDVIKSMNLSIENENEDRLEIDDLLKDGEFIMHHSNRFNELYKPHYRIIERKIFEQEILPNLNNNK